MSKGIALIVSLVGLGLLVILALLHSQPAKRLFLGQASDYLDRKLGVDLQVAEFDYNLLNLSFSLRGLRARSDETSTSPPFLSAEAITFRLGLWNLLRGVPHIRSAHFQGVVLHTSGNERGDWNLPVGQDREPRAAMGFQLPEFSIDHLILERGGFILEDTRLGFRADIPAIRMEIESGDQGRLHRILLKMGSPGELRVGTQRLRLDLIESHMRLGPDQLTIDRLLVESGNSQVSAGGSFRSFRELDLKVNAKIDLNQLSELLSLSDLPLTGVLEAETRVRNPLDRLRVEGQLKGAGLRLGVVSGVDLQAVLDWSLPEQRLLLSPILIRSPFGGLEGTLHLALAEEDSRTRFNARIRQLELEAVTRAAKSPIQLASRVSGEVTAEWPGLDLAGLLGEASLKFTSTRRRPTAQSIPVSGSLTLQAGGQQLQSSLKTIRIAGVEIAGEVAVRSATTLEEVLNGNLSGRLRGHVASVGELISDLEALFSRTQEWPGADKVRGDAEFEASLAGTVTDPKLSFQARADALDLDPLQGLNVRLALDYAGTRLSVREARLYRKDFRWESNGTVDLGPDDPVLDLSGRIETLALASLLAGLELDVPLEGLVEGDATLRGSARRPRGDLRLSAHDLKAWGSELGRLALRAGLEDQKLTVEEFRLAQESGSGLLEGQGNLDLQSGLYQFQASVENLEIAPQMLPEGLDVEGRLGLQATGGGTWVDPSIEAAFQLQSPAVNDFRIESIEGAAKWEGSGVSLRAWTPTRNIELNADGDLTNPYPASAELHFKDFDLTPLAAALASEQGITGRMTGQIAASADLADWQQGDLTVLLTSFEMALLDRVFRNQTPVRAAFRDGILSVESLSIASQNSELEVSGTFPLLDPSAEGQIHSRASIDLSEVFSTFPLPLQLGLEGRLDLEATVAGSRGRVQPSILLSSEDLALSHPALVEPLSAVQLGLELKDGWVRLIQLSGALASGSFTASGRFPLAWIAGDLPVEIVSGSGAAEIDLSLQDLPLELFQELPEAVTGRVSARLSARAPEMRLSEVSAGIVFETLEGEVAGNRIRQDGQTAVSLSQSVVKIDQLALEGPSLTVRAAGTWDLIREVVNLQVDGDVDTEGLNRLTRAVAFDGDAHFRIDLRGPIRAPERSGQLQLDDGSVRLRSPRLQAQQVDLEVSLSEDRLEISRLEGELNGGSFQVRGGLDLEQMGIRGVDLNLVGQDIFLDFPEGLKTASRVDVRLESDGELIIIGGQVQVLDGSYTRRFDLEAELLRFLRSGETGDPVSEPNPLLSRLRFNLGLNTLNPLVVRNNLANLLLRADLRLTGSPQRPAMTGRIELEEGGEIYLRERSYTVERGSILLLDDTTIRPTFDVLARTEARGYQISLEISGGIDDIQTNLTSDPPLAEPDIVSVLVTGRTLEEVSGAEVQVAQQQALSYLAGGLGDRLSSGAEQALGLSKVRIEPHLISAESDPSARLTVGQNVTSDLSLIYSMNLADGSDQIYIAEYDLARGLTTRAIKQEDNTYRFEFSHRLRLGESGTRKPIDSTEKPVAGRLGAITFEGDTLYSPDELAKKSGLKSGATYDFLDVQNALDRLQRLYRNDARLESLILLRRQPSENQVDLHFSIQPGPRVGFSYSGAALPGSVRSRVRQAWGEGVFDSQRLEDTRMVIEDHLVKRGHLAPQVIQRLVTTGDEKTVHFEVDSGPLFRNVELVFQGAAGLQPELLRQRIERAGLFSQIFLDPPRLTRFLTQTYRDEGYLDARISDPRVELDTQTGSGRVIFAVDEGRPQHLGEITFQGYQFLEEKILREAVPLLPGSVYRPKMSDEAADKVRELYAQRGFNNVAIEVRVERTPPDRINLIVRIREGLKGIVTEILVSGNQRTSDRFVKKQLAVGVGEPLDFQSLSRSRKNLYDTGAFSLVEIDTEVLSATSLPGGDSKPVRLSVKVREPQPFSVRYGGFYDTDRGLGVVGSFRNRNSLGSARTLGLTGRFDNDVREVRGFFSQPYLRNLAWRSTLSGFTSREIFPTFITDRIGFSFQQEKELREKFLVTYAYRFERNDTFDKDPDSLFQIPPFKVAAINTTLSRDTRDNLLDATRGSFLSQAFELAASGLGSDIRFAKYFGQYSKFFPLTQPQEIPFSGGLRQPRVVFATGVRVGLAQGLGDQELIFSERFFAGGGTTIRGFAQNSVGPTDFFGDPVGGDAVFILNNELRFPVVGMLDGVAFLDVGNVYARLSDFDPLDVRKAAGLGLRFRNPYLLLRLDYGFKLDRQPGESAGELFFSIGQAF